MKQLPYMYLTESARRVQRSKRMGAFALLGDPEGADILMSMISPLGGLR